ncbi:MAG: hypothetical protein JHD19_19465 [Pseudomonas sp.]|uniref:hypothetical protein n=1 Tax=Pseudomonas sp. TaxID=306 RepID=UPI001A2CC015|nr:hypothetical protein [Pseudomonas sp.]MBJ7373632.1 hypothetical protein [Pseudomonas sp.]
MTVENEEGRLLNVIAEIGMLEWQKYQQRFPKIRVGNEMQREDHSALPPFVAFRFECINKVDIDKLKAAVEGYEGALSWSLVGRPREGLPGINWMIAPSRLWEVGDCASQKNMTAAVYLSTHEPSLGPLAYEDLTGLAEHVRSAFNL